MSSVVIAEDKEFLVKIIKNCLGEGVECGVAKDGASALAMLGDADAIVVSDNLPDYKKDTLLRKIRSERRSLPVLMLTSEVSSAFRILYLSAGADDVMTKPFNPDELKLRVKRLLK